MPVTARLSRKFYDKFGDDVTNELVDWFNQVDATYRSDLRELNELNFARFDAKVDQRLGQLEARLDARIDRIESQLKGYIEHRFGEYTRWLFVAWSSLLIPIIGLWFK